MVARFSTIGILLVADDPGFLRALARFLQHFEGITIQAMASDPEDAVWLAARLQPQALIIDYGISGPLGLSTVKSLRAVLSQACIIFVHRHDEQQCAGARALGASACIERRELLIELIPTLHRLLHLPHSPRIHAQIHESEAASADAA